VQTEEEDPEGTTSHYVSQVLVGFSGSMIDAMDGQQVGTYAFWQSMAMLKSHLRLIDLRASELGPTDQAEHTEEWSTRVAPLLRQSLDAASLMGAYNVHSFRASFDTAVRDGIRLDQNYPCGDWGGPMYSIFVISKDPQERSQPNMALAKSRSVARIPPEEFSIADELVAAVDSMRVDQRYAIPPYEDDEPCDRFYRAMDYLAGWSLLPNHFTAQGWRTILNATEEERPEATPLQALSTAACLTELVERCPALSGFRLEVHAGQTVLDWHDGMARSVYF